MILRRLKKAQGQSRSYLPDGQISYLVNGFGGYAGGIVRVHNALCRELSARGRVFVASAPVDQEADLDVQVLSRQVKSRRRSLLSDVRVAFPKSSFDVRIDSAPAFRLFTKSKQHAVIVHDLNFLHREIHDISMLQLVYRRLLHAWVLPRADLIVANSETTRREIISFRPNLQTPIRVLPLPVDHVDNALKRPALEGEGRTRTRVMTFGHARNKGVEHLLRLMRDRPDLELTVIASAELWDEFWSDEASAQGVTERVRVMSGLTDHQLYEQYVSSDVFCMLSGYEGYGLPAAEALRLGTPTVVTDIPVLRETSRGYAVTVNPAKPKALDAAIRDAVSMHQSHWDAASADFGDWSWSRWTTDLLRGLK